MSDIPAWMRQYLKQYENPERIQCATCKIETFFSRGTRILDFQRHLCHLHKITELNDHPERNKLKRYFEIIYERDCIGICVFCKMRVEYGRGVYLLKNHLEIYHEPRSTIYIPIINSREGREMLDKCVITGGNAKCIKCELIINLDVLLEDRRLPTLRRHFNKYHSGMNKSTFVLAETYKKSILF